MKKTKKNIQLQLLLLLILVLPFGLRHIFNFGQIESLEFFRESLSLSVYLFDAVFLLLLWQWIANASGAKTFPSLPGILNYFVKNFRKNIFFGLLIAYFAWLSFFVAANASAALYMSARVIQGLILFAIASRLAAKSYKNFQKIVYLIFLSGIIQSVIAVWQFLKQGSIGLKILGESRISPEIAGVAKFEIAGEKFIRAYGTFPHPNVLGAFLLLAMVCGLGFLFFHKKEIPFRFPLKLFKIDKTKAVILHYSAGTMLILLGVLVSYSRSVWLVAFLLILVVFWKYFAEFARNYFSKKFLKRFGASLFAVVLIACAGVYILASPRLCIQDCAGGQSFELRQKYAQYAFETILDNAYYGAGTGNFVLGMKDARPFNFETWQIQPVHNLYLLIAAEIGLIGFLFLFLFVFKRLKNLNKLSESWNKTGVYALAGFLSLGFFDHYFWTIPQTILFFWLAIALIPGSSKIKKANKETTEK